MRILKSCSSFVVLLCTIFSCTYNDINKTKVEQSLVVGHWDSYEGKSAAGIAPGVVSGLTLMYEHGLVFSEDGKFGPRYYIQGVWTESLSGGTYHFKDEQTLLLIFSPNTKDELTLPLRIIKLDSDHMWFQHSFWVNEQNPFPVEVHMKRAE